MKLNYFNLIILIFSALYLFSCGEDTTNENTKETPQNKSILTQDQKYALAYMWHEEKLAYDIYYTLNQNTPNRQLENIANRSETKHIEMVQDLIEKYNLDITNATDIKSGYTEEVLESMPVGEFKIGKIQDLYNALYDKGIKSLKDALEVACMVEVTDIDDLSEFIEKSQNADDLVETFINLRNGSYNHYWAFDKALKDIGIEEGCCSLGEINGKNYCHPEYPEH